MQDLYGWLDATALKRPDLKDPIEKIKQRIDTNKSVQLLVEDEFSQLQEVIEKKLKEKFN